MPCVRFALAVILQVMSLAAVSATQPCPTPTFAPCNAVLTTTEVSVAYTNSRAGHAVGSFSLRGEYGEGTSDIIERENLYSVKHAVRSTEYISSTAEAKALDLSMLALANSEADLARGSAARTDRGIRLNSFPASIFEISSARVDLTLQETINFHLPANYDGGKVRVYMTVDGAIEDARPNGFTGNSEVYAQLFSGTSFDSNRWNDAGIISDILSVEMNLPKTSSSAIDLPLGFNAFLRLLSGEGDGSYLINFSNTATLGLEVPEGVTWESQSGVFLAAVPLPAAAWLFSSGIVLITVVARRRASSHT